MEYSTTVAVIGAGHAGIEAALATARLGFQTILFTINLDAVANMPCNPSIGGSGKGHLVYEIDALGGEMGVAADKVTLQSRTLNLGKGAAVHSKRVQADRMHYRAVMKATLEKTENLRLLQSEVVDLITEERDGKRTVTGVKTQFGDVVHAEKVIIAAGTFLEGRIFVGHNSFESGPDGMLPAKGLSAALLREGVRLMRFKTGTPARVLRSSIDLDRLEIQNGEDAPTPFSTLTDKTALGERPKLPCHVVYTNEKTHTVIRENLKESAMYGGKIQGTGPRYCPSIEDKIVRFADKERHQLFIEPCGADTEEMYVQGLSTSMPTHVQTAMLHSLDGFENAVIMRYAYAIEYDCCDPTQLLPTLEFKEISGLYGAGQFNGTSGYEEAAAQGLVAGINAALALRGDTPMILPRSSSYIGTLIDDLVTKGTNEPYRIMTSRSEYRLLLRQDNADTRLTEIGHRVGLISDTRFAAFAAKRAAIEEEKKRLSSLSVSPTEETNSLLASVGSAPITHPVKMADLLRRPEMTYAALAPLDRDRPSLPETTVLTAEIELKYDGYIRRELAEVARQEKLEQKPLPLDLDYTKVKGLRIEAAQKLNAIRPTNLGQASRISGVNPADISVLIIYMKQGKL